MLLASRVDHNCCVLGTLAAFVFPFVQFFFFFFFCYPFDVGRFEQEISLLFYFLNLSVCVFLKFSDNVVVVTALQYTFPSVFNSIQSNAKFRFCRHRLNFQKKIYCINNEHQHHPS